MIRTVTILLLVSALAGCSGTAEVGGVPPRLSVTAPDKAGAPALAHKAGWRADRDDIAFGARRSARPLAAFDDPELHYRLALSYATGHGAPQDDTAAVHWYRLAAGEGHAAASYQLGLSYADGRGVSPNSTLAALWYWQAAMRGHAPAQYRLGLGYATGTGIARDDVQAARWFRSAAQQGQPQAQAAIGVMYVGGRGVAMDPVRGYMWLSLAAEAGVASADAVLKVLRLVMTAAQITEAGQLADDWRAANPL